MILIISNAADATADFFEARLADAGASYERLNTEALASLPITMTFSESDATTLAMATFGAAGGRRLVLDDVRAIYYRRPVSPTFPEGTPPGLADWMESEVRRTWGGMLGARTDLRWVNHPLAVSGASYKPEQIARALRMGLNVPATLITTDPQAAANFCAAHNWCVIAKPVGHGEILGTAEADDRIVYTNRVTRAAADRLSRVSACPTLLQREIVKDLDLRVTVVGRDVIATALHSQERESSSVDCRRDIMSGMRYSPVTLPPDLVTLLADIVASYGLLYAALDLVRDRDCRYWFLELNPAGQWAWLEQVADVPISAALIRCLTNE